MNRNPFKNLTVLITGASLGIGESLARELAKDGANLILVARSKEKLEALASELRKTYSIETHVFVSDLTQVIAPRSLFEAIRKANLHVDLLINNAGFGFCGPFEESILDKNQAMIELNVNALVQLTQLFLPAMLQKGKGGILNVASTAAYQPLPKMALYGATKAFVLSFTEALYAEYQNRGIRIFCLSPGNTKTNFHEVAGVKPRRIFFSSTSEEVARFALWNFAHTQKPSAVFGLRNKILAYGSKLFPRRVVLAIASQIYR